jgi:hypothetical protein
MKELNYGKGYKYAHDESEGIADMDCLPASLSGKTYYQPTSRGFEETIRNDSRTGKRHARNTENDRGGARPAFLSRDETPEMKRGMLGYFYRERPRLR